MRDLVTAENKWVSQSRNRVGSPFVLKDLHLNLGADYMRRAGPLSQAGSVCRDLGTSVKHTKINFAITWKKFSPASWDPGIAMPGSRLARMSFLVTKFRFRAK